MHQTLSLPSVLLRLAPVLLRLASLGALVTSVSCFPESSIRVEVPEEDFRLGFGAAAAWLGTFEGAGEGLVAGSSTSVMDARLVISRDADSVRISSCPDCLTITLDTLFALANVAPVSEVELMLEYRTGDARHRLRLDRYSSGTIVGNVLSARLQIDPDMTPPGRSDMEYVFTRR